MAAIRTFFLFFFQSEAQPSAQSQMVTQYRSLIGSSSTTQAFFSNVVSLYFPIPTLLSTLFEADPWIDDAVRQQSRLYPKKVVSS